MLKVISHGGKVEKYSYFIFYEWVEIPFAGFSFDCNMQGEIKFNDLSPEALVHYGKCESGEYEVIYRGLQREDQSYFESKVAECYCGEPIVLELFTNECSHCHQHYNIAGQQLVKKELL